MDRIINIETTGNITSALFLTNDVSEANLLKRAILSEIETYAIDIVTFQTNTSPRHDEIIAFRLGQLVIDHARFIPPEEGNFQTHIDKQGPGEFTTDDIPALPFKFKTPIATLKTGQSIVCDVTVRKGQGRQHVKWRPVSTVIMTEVNEGYRMTIKDVGMLSGREIFERGYAKMRDAANRQPITLFSQILVPAQFQ